MAEKYPLYYLINIYGTKFKLSLKTWVCVWFFLSSEDNPLPHLCLNNIRYLLSIKLAHYFHAFSAPLHSFGQQVWWCSWAQLCLCTSSCCTAAAERNSNSLGANDKTLPAFVEIYSILNKWDLTGYQLHTWQDSSGSQTRTTVNVLSNPDKSSNWNYYVKQTIKNQMNDDSVCSILIGIWTPQNLKCINCCFLSLILSYGSDKSSVLLLKNNLASKLALSKKRRTNWFKSQQRLLLPPPPGTTAQPDNKPARTTLIFNLNGLFWKKSPFRPLFIELCQQFTQYNVKTNHQGWIFQQVWDRIHRKKIPTSQEPFATTEILHKCLCCLS